MVGRRRGWDRQHESWALSPSFPGPWCLSCHFILHPPAAVALYCPLAVVKFLTVFTHNLVQKSTMIMATLLLSPKLSGLKKIFSDLKNDI